MHASDEFSHHGEDREPRCTCKKESRRDFPEPRRCRQPSRRAMLPEKLLDLVVGRKSAFTRRRQATVDASEFGRRRLVRASAELCINLKRKLGEFGLSGLGQASTRPKMSLRFFAVLLGTQHKIQLRDSAAARYRTAASCKNRLCGKSSEEISSQSNFLFRAIRFRPTRTRGARFSRRANVITFLRLIHLNASQLPHQQTKLRLSKRSNQ